MLYFASAIVCSSDHALGRFANEYPESVHKMHLAQDGADEHVVVDVDRINSLKESLDLDSTKLCVVYSGVLIDSKGLLQLKQLIKACKADSEKFQFLVIGYPVDELSDYLKENKLESLCQLTGRVEFSTLRDYLSLSDVAVEPKNSEAGEGSGKMLNYLAAGLPVVAFDTRNNRVFLDHNTSTLCDSVSDMRHRLLDLHSNRDLRDELGQSNYQQFVDKYSWAVTARQLGEVYDTQHISKPTTCRESNSGSSSEYDI